jgi:hypothetical protein
VTEAAPIPPEVRTLAEDGNALTLPFPGEERIADRRFVVRFMTFPTGPFNQVCRIRLEPGEVEAAVAEVRALLAERGRAGACEWEVGSAATPADLLARLETFGITPNPEQPSAPAMALVAPPRVRPRAGVRVSRVVTPEDAAHAAEVRARGFLGEQPWSPERRAAIAAEYAAIPKSEGSTTYLAWIDDRPVAAAEALYAAAGVIAAGAATLPEARGKGAFQSLVLARWEDAAARGTPALVCHAGDMSRPILERLGFVPVARMFFLNDSWKPE